MRVRIPPALLDQRRLNKFIVARPSGMQEGLVVLCSPLSKPKDRDMSFAKSRTQRQKRIVDNIT